ncbi:hypothetical protein ACFVT1_33680 [Streptomyces sp. NPDC057963]|uniref:hypothetical protein n=1 Tax=Streptomyces sp. NPDC057963 TaxID=3346290 RepID=UPI0036EC2246
MSRRGPASRYPAGGGTPDAAARKAFGGNPLDPGHRAAAARAGLARAASHTEAVAAVVSS